MGTIKPFRIKSFKKLNSAIEFRDISLAYGNRFILKNINFKIQENTIHGLLGPNGAGSGECNHRLMNSLNKKALLLRERFFLF